MTEAPRVLVSISDHVAHVRLNRPDKRNGLDLPMFEALVETAERIQHDRSVRAVVLSGEGKVFCAGLDWTAFLQMGAEGTKRLLTRDPQKSPANLAQHVCWVWAELPMPVIAAVHGSALGGGLQLALACDLRIVSKDALLAVAEIRYGLIPDMSASQTLLRLVRPDVARELMYTGRNVDAGEALRIGLATRIADDPLQAASELAGAIAAQSPEAIRAAKRFVHHGRDLPLEDALRFETELQMKLLSTPNQLEATRAMMTKSAPRFSDPE